MKEYRLERVRRARVWLDESLPAGYTGNALQRDVCAAKSHLHMSRMVALEARVPEGAIVRYGLLGAQFSPGVGDALAIEILVGSTDVLFQTPLATTPEQVLVGLTQSYAEAVAEVFITHAPLLLGSGVLSVRWGAHGVIGSSPAFFAAIARAVVELLAQADVGDEVVKSCLAGWFGRGNV